MIGELTEVRFGGSDKVKIHRDFAPHVEFESPEWVKGRNEQYPVGIKAGTTATVSAIFQIVCNKVLENPSQKVYAKGINAKGFQLASKELIRNGILATYDFQALSAAFAAGTVDFFDPFKITWYISTDEKDWKKAGMSENRLYVPLSKVLDGCALDDSRAFYSVIHYACEPAKGQTTRFDIFTGIWNKFKTLSLPRIDKPSKNSFGVPNSMQYWGEANPLAQGCRGTKGLLHYEAANCGEWSIFMRYCLGMNGLKDGCSGVIEAVPGPSTAITDAQNEFIAKFGAAATVFYDRSVFLVKNWNIPVLNQFYYDGRKYISTGGGNQYTNITGTLMCTNGDNIERGDVIGDKAQGITDPETLFEDHAVICYPNGTIYDPSYGTGPFADIRDWETNSVDAYAYEIFFFDDMNDKYISIVYPYQREDLKKQQVIYSCH